MEREIDMKEVLSAVRVWEARLFWIPLTCGG